MRNAMVRKIIKMLWRRNIIDGDTKDAIGFLLLIIHCKCTDFFKAIGESIKHLLKRILKT